MKSQFFELGTKLKMSTGRITRSRAKLIDRENLTEVTNIVNTQQLQPKKRGKKAEKSATNSKFNMKYEKSII